MCGISGIYHLNRKALFRPELERFNNSMSHRGPDDDGLLLLDNDSLGLAQRRLSILDLSMQAHQPMQTADGRFAITYNGEIFNFQEIRDSLISIGYNFRSTSDTEVILAAYQEWGPLCLKKFNGMWAFAIWDERNRELFLARDRFGIKPLYYLNEENERFAFASETRAFKYLNQYNREIDDTLLSLNLADPYAIEGLGYTVFKNIKQLLPGHFMIVKRNELVSQTRWWSIEDCHPEIPVSFGEQCEKFYEIFRDACRMRLISDVPLATALSGGLDSTSVYNTVYDILSKENVVRVSPDAQRAFTASFPGLPNDERHFAELAIKSTGGAAHFVDPDILGLAERIEKETKLADFISVSPLSSISSVYEAMSKQGIKISLDGHGVDEMMYGYRDMVYGLYNESLWFGSKNRATELSEVLIPMYHPDHREAVNDKFRKQFEEKILRESSIRFKLKKAVRKDNQSPEFLPPILPALSDKPYNFSSKSYQERMVYNEFFQHTLPALLRNFDRAGMMNGVEIRMPFMDWRLVSYTFALPFEAKIGKGYTKRILREAMKGKMDESLRTRTFKVGIGSPVHHWLNGPLKDWAFSKLQDEFLKMEAEKMIKEQGSINQTLVRNIWQNINYSLIKE